MMRLSKALIFIFQAVAAWVILAVVMFANGAVRVVFLQPRMGEHTARQVATATGVLIVLTAAFLFVRRIETPARGELWQVGGLWLVLTLLFEFGLGAATGASWAEMLADYDVLNGRLWSLIPLAALVAPRLAGLVPARSS